MYRKCEHTWGVALATALLASLGQGSPLPRKPNSTLLTDPFVFFSLTHELVMWLMSKTAAYYKQGEFCKQHSMVSANRKLGIWWKRNKVFGEPRTRPKLLVPSPGTGPVAGTQ